jgi:HAD superfamily hydrolase (TIGR01549 family)
MTVRGILFDIGDTLLPASALQQSTLEDTAQVLEQNGAIPDAAAYVSAYERADADPELVDLPDLNHLYSDARVISHALTSLGLPAQKAFVQGVLEQYRTRLRAAIHPDPQLADTLRRLVNLGIRLGIVSNGTTDEQMEQLQLLGVADMFSPIVISQDVGVRKPDPRIFEMGRKPWRVSAAAVLVVGDRPDWDVEGPHRAGMQSALTIQHVNHEAALSDIQPTFVITHVTELCELLKH